ncbi:MAG TPA: kynureninase [Gemmatimonadales bacterium]|nr:kynureninase [Gemmatimonadales bacterium]
MSGYAPEEAWAREADAGDPVGWGRAAFALPAGPDGAPLLYFCGNSLGLMPQRARALVDAELADWAGLGVEGHFAARRPWYSYHAALREPLARLVGALPHEVVAMNALTINLHLLLVSFYRPAGRRVKILIEEAAFPSDAYAVASHLDARGIGADAVVVARPRPGESLLRIEDLEALLAEGGSEIAVVWLGAVHYYTGQLLALERLSRAARAAGCVVGFDLAHAAGNVPLELHAWEVDFAVWCSYKYLNAGPGAVAGCFLHERHHAAGLPRFAGWWGNDPATRFQMQSRPVFVPVAGADGWQVSNPPILALAPLLASLELFDRAGMAALREKSERLTGYLAFLVERLSGITLLTPRDPAARGCQLSLRAGRGAEDLVAALRARGVVTDYREPDVVRVAPVPLYNTFHEVWRFAQILGELLARR